jgi:23S rRNA pseudouridine1911/1915/1917 synthase
VRIVPPEAPRQRIDRYLADADTGLSRSKIQNLIRNEAVAVNARTVSRPGQNIGPGDEIRIAVPVDQPVQAEPEDIPLDIIYEDDALLVVNKSPGMVVHPACGHRSGTLVNALLYHCGRLSSPGELFRPGIVHRLDKDTSGLLVVAKRDDVHVDLAQQIEARSATRRYTAVVWGIPSPTAGSVNEPVGRHPRHRQRMAVVPNGKPAVTHYEVTETLAFCSVLSVKLETGRTHQIRVHMGHLGNPVFGDSTYGGRVKRLGRLSPPDRRSARSALEQMPRQALHAAELEFCHPLTGETISCRAPNPEDMTGLLRQLRISSY